MDDRTRVSTVDSPRIDLLDASGGVRSLAEIEADAIRLALAHCGHSVPRAARLLGIGRSTIYRKVNEGWRTLSKPPLDERLTAPRQHELLQLITKPSSAPQIARAMRISRQAAYKLLDKLIRDGKAVRLPSARRNGWLYVSSDASEVAPAGCGNAAR